MAEAHGVKPPFEGPLERGRWPDRVCARVVTPGDEPRVHGYLAETDLAMHYRATECVLLALTGELPAAEQAAAFEVACVFLAPLSVAHASTHAAVLGRLCGAPPSGIIAVAAVALSEQARVLVEEHGPFLAWLASPTGALPSAYVATTEAQTEATQRLTRALATTGLSVAGLRLNPTRDAALVSTLFACGLTRREQLEAAIVHARLPIVVAEAFAESAANLGKYPINVPRFHYEPPA